MQTLREHIDSLLETYVNLVGDDEKVLAKKEKYVDQVWDLLQHSYADIGGIKGNGFTTKEEMIREIPFWKLGVRDGKVHAAIMYKERNGRKSVAAGSDGSKEADFFITELFAKELQRAYGEKSKAALGKTLKITPWEVLEPFIKTPEEASELLGKEVISVADYPADDLPEDAQDTLGRKPQLYKYGYLRKIQGEMTFKVLLGTPGLRIR